MVEPEPRPSLESLAARLLADLPQVVVDPVERRAVAERIEHALTTGDRDALLDAVVADPRTRRWYDRASPLERDVERLYQDLPGRAVSLSMYYVCPEGHEESVLRSRPVAPPRCPACDRPMITED